MNNSNKTLIEAKNEAIAANRCYRQPFIELYNEDCLIGMKRIPDNSVQCVLTDPPYLYLKGQKLEREFTGWEIDEEYYSKAVERIKSNVVQLGLF